MFFSASFQALLASARPCASVPGSGNCNEDKQLKGVFLHRFDLLFGLVFKAGYKPVKFGIFFAHKGKYFFNEYNNKRHGNKVAHNGYRYCRPVGKPIPTPMGIAPRSSITGTIETKKVIISFPRVVLKNDIKTPSGERHPTPFLSVDFSHCRVKILVNPLGLTAFCASLCKNPLLKKSATQNERDFRVDFYAEDAIRLSPYKDDK